MMETTAIARKKLLMVPVLSRTRAVTTQRSRPVERRMSRIRYLLQMIPLCGRCRSAPRGAIASHGSRMFRTLRPAQVRVDMSIAGQFAVVGLAVYSSANSF